MKFVARVTVLDHNFSYASLLIHLGFSVSADTLAGLDIQKTLKTTPRAEKKKQMKKKVSSKDYRLRQFLEENLVTKRKVAPSDTLTCE